MDLQTRKLNFIQDFLKLESEKAIAQFEKLLQKETSSPTMSRKEFKRRYEASNEDSKNGRVTEAQDLISEIEKWS